MVPKTRLVVDAGCWLGSKGKHPEKKNPPEAALSLALGVTGVISVPDLNA